MIAATLARISQVKVTVETLSVDLDDGRTISVPIGWYPRLAYGSPAERANFQISGGGYGIHWPDLDEDMGVEGLLLGKKSRESRVSFARWLQRRDTNADKMAGRAKVKRRSIRQGAQRAARRRATKSSRSRARGG